MVVVMMGNVQLDGELVGRSELAALPARDTGPVACTAWP